MRHVALMGCFLVIVGSLGVAQEPGKRERQNSGSTWEFFAKKYDGNQDNKISKEEYTRSDTSFGRLDKNKDGVLTPADFSGGRRGGRRGSRRAGMGSMMFKRLASRLMDEDKDGAVSAAEWASFKKTNDGNQDGEISSEEFTAGKVPERMVRMMVRMFDADQSGSVSVAELDAQFAKVDADKSGALEASEIKMSRRGGGRREGRSGRGQGDSSRPAKANKGVPQPGDVAPDFILPLLGKGKKTAQLSSFAGKKPVALIFGSYT